jgi:hypothetical protein
MELPQPAASSRERLQHVREAVLALHKSVLESERTAYEITHGPIPSPGHFLNLLINDAAFAWLQPLTTLIVQIDEALAAKRPPATEQTFEQLLGDTRALLSPSTEQSSFWHRYSAVVQRDPAVSVLHQDVSRELEG